MFVVRVLMWKCDFKCPCRTVLELYEFFKSRNARVVKVEEGEKTVKMCLSLSSVDEVCCLVHDLAVLVFNWLLNSDDVTKLLHVDLMDSEGRLFAAVTVSVDKPCAWEILQKMLPIVLEYVKMALLEEFRSPQR